MYIDDMYIDNYVDNFLTVIDTTIQYIQNNPKTKLYCVYEYECPQYLDIFDESNLKRFAEDHLDINNENFKNIETLIEYIRENGYYVTEFNNNL